MPSVSEHIAAILATHTDHVFGVMGNGNAYFIDALIRHSEATFTAVRHEAGAVAAADAYYRASQRIAAATTTYGAGFTNTLTALAESAMAATPLVLVVGGKPTTGARPWDVDQSGLAAALGVTTFTVNIEDAAHVTQRALGQALCQRQPVVLTIPHNVSTTEIGSVPTVEPFKSAEHPTLNDSARTQIQRAANLLATAERPFLLAGRGAHLSEAGQELGRLAETTGAVTGSTALGRGIFPDQNHDLGVTGGFGAPAAMDLVQQADVAVVVGASLNQFTMRFGDLFAPETIVIQVDSAPEPTCDRVHMHIQGDARLVLCQLITDLADTPSSRWRETVDMTQYRHQDSGHKVASDGLMDPRSAAKRIGHLLPADTVVVSDGGHFIGWANMFWSISAPEHMIMVGTAFQSIGLGFPSVAGAAAGSDASTIVLTTGDGGGLMALADLETAIRTAGGRGICVVWNDAAYGAEVHLYGAKGLTQEPMHIPQADFAAVAVGFGAETHVIHAVEDLHRLEQWLAQPVAERRFLLLDLRISPQVMAPYQREVLRANARSTPLSTPNDLYRLST